MRFFTGAGAESDRAQVLSTWLFLRLLGLCYFCAFASLYVQVPGLLGHDGILPVADFLPAVQKALGTKAYRVVPTLCWLSQGDAFLRFLCGGGALLSLLLLAGMSQAGLLFVLWAFYLSISSVGQEFLSFQWDSLLSETGFLAIFLGSFRGMRVPPSPAILWLLRFLLFRLMFSSGKVKLMSGDPAWRDLTALEYHFWTQPIPNLVAYYADKLPAWSKTLSTGIMFGIELVVPFFIFFPQRIRKWAFFPLAGLQGLIALTGNYGFFNLLSVALCVPLLPDSWMHRVLPQRIADRLSALPRRSRGRGIATALLFSVMLGLTVLEMTAPHLPRGSAPLRWLRAVAPFRVVSSYGLFAVMTTTRPEIIVEGSNDGKNWLAYEFPYKPGDLRRAPPFVAPHMPRLDWQMWFAALGSREENPWFSHFCVRLLQGSRPVLDLLSYNPFPDAPPRYLRARVFDYKFSGLAEKRSTGVYWTRTEEGTYLPVVSLHGRPE